MFTTSMEIPPLSGHIKNDQLSNRGEFCCFDSDSYPAIRQLRRLLHTALCSEPHALKWQKGIKILPSNRSLVTTSDTSNHPRVRLPTAWWCVISVLKPQHGIDAVESVSLISLSRHLIPVPASRQRRRERLTGRRRSYTCWDIVVLRWHGLRL